MQFNCNFAVYTINRDLLGAETVVWETSIDKTTSDTN